MLDKKKVKLGIAPIGWTNDDMPIWAKKIPLNSVSVKWLWRDLQDLRSAGNIRKMRKY